MNKKRTKNREKPPIMRFVFNCEGGTGGGDAGAGVLIMIFSGVGSGLE
jgi:hypothetical protein